MYKYAAREYRKTCRPEMGTVVNYHDCSLSAEDVARFEAPSWLNDSCITFAFEYFTHDKYQRKAHQYAFVHPATVFLAAMVEDALGLGPMLAPLALDEKGLVFLPINDNTDVTAAGGSHWSLLVFSRNERKFFHFDSMSTHNHTTAVSCAKKFSRLLGGDAVEELRCQRQTNGYDCGVHVVALADHIALHNDVYSGCEAQLDPAAYRRNLQSIVADVQCRP